MSLHKVLIVDDDADDREMTHDAFATASTKNLDFHFIGDGEKLIEYLFVHADNHLP